MKKLKNLQRKKLWDIIFYCRAEICPKEKWIPKHRIVKADDKETEEKKMKDILDLIKEPDYNRFEFERFLPLASESLTVVEETNLKIKYEN